MIYISHGVISAWASDRLSHALFLCESSLRQHFSRRATKYVSLRQALNGDGDALTIDDSTYGGLNMALLAREYGHAVTWFINGKHVEEKLPYFPFQLSWMIDTCDADECTFNGVNWKLRVGAGRRALRLSLKRAYMQMGCEAEVRDLVDTMAERLNVDLSAMDQALETVTAAELAQAAIAGVELQNHSWSHLNPLALSEGQRTKEVLQNEEYLSGYRKGYDFTYAPPFGHMASLACYPTPLSLLANRDLLSGYHAGQVVNRIELQLNESLQMAWPITLNNLDVVAALNR